MDQCAISNLLLLLLLLLSIFISLKYQRQTSGERSRKLSHDFMNGNGNLRPTYGFGGVWMEKSKFHGVCTALYAFRWIATDYLRHT